MANILRKKYGDEINKWTALIHLNQEDRKVKQPSWDKIDLYFRGWQWNQFKDSDDDVVTVNMVYSHLKVVVPSTYLRYPKIFFKANSPSAVDASRLLEVILNADMRAMKLKDVNKECIQDVVLYGTAFTKTTFEIDEGYDIYQENKEQVDQLIETFRDIQPKAVGNLKIPHASPRIVRPDPEDVNFAVGATDFYDPGFVSHTAVKRLSAVKGNPFYKNTKDLKATDRIKNELRSSLGKFVGYGAEDYLDLVVIHEIWDVDNQRWFTIAEGHDQYLTDPEDNPYPYEHPFDILRVTRLKGQMWGMSEIEPWLPQQDELNKIRTQQLSHLKRGNRKYALIENSLSNEDEVAKLESGDDGVVIKFRAIPGRSARDMVAPIDEANISPDFYRMNVQVEDDIVKIGRITPYRRAGVVGANTATEANLAESSAQISDSERADTVGEFTLNQLEKVRKARRALTIGQEIIDVTGNPLDLERWKYWTREDIDLESLMCIEYGSTQPINDEQRISKAVLLYDRAIANPTVNPQSAFAKLLEAFGEQDMPSWWLPNEMIQIQMMLKMMGAAREQKGISPTGPTGANEPGPIQPKETPAEMRGRAAPSTKKVAANG